MIQSIPLHKPIESQFFKQDICGWRPEPPCKARHPHALCAAALRPYAPAMRCAFAMRRRYAQLCAPYAPGPLCRLLCAARPSVLAAGHMSKVPFRRQKTPIALLLFFVLR